MTDLSTLRALQKRIREATGPDRELDAEITVALTPTKETADDLIYLIVPRREDYCTPGTYWRKSRSGASLHTAPLLTTDPDGLGACVALMREVLPGWDFELTSEGRCGDFWAALYPVDDDRRARILGPDNDQGLIRISKSICCSFIDAIISARIAELEAEQAKEPVG